MPTGYFIRKVYQEVYQEMQNHSPIVGHLSCFGLDIIISNAAITYLLILLFSPRLQIISLQSEWRIALNQKILMFL